MKKYSMWAATLTMSIALAIGGNVVSAKTTKKPVTCQPAITTCIKQKDDLKQNGFHYKKTKKGIILTGYDGTQEKLHIPSKIKGKKVIEIGESCFAGNIHLKKVCIPEGVEVVGDYAFECCSVLEKVYFPESLKNIGDGAFSGCGMLKMADTQDGIESIGDGAFLYCTSLKVWEGSATLSTMGDYAFSGCSGLYNVDLSETQLDAIPDRAFLNCTKLVDVKLPDTIRIIGIRAFENCESLTYLYLTDSLESISEYSFHACKSMDSINLYIEEIPDYACAECNNMTYVALSENLKRIGTKAFANTKIVKEYTYIPEGADVAEDAFADTPEMEEEDYESDHEEPTEEITEQPEEATTENVTDQEEKVILAETTEEEEISEETPEETTEVKEIAQIEEAAKEAGYKVVAPEEFDEWADAYLEYNKDNALLDSYYNPYISMYKREIEQDFVAMTAVASGDPEAIENAKEIFGQDFIPMYTMVNHGLSTEIKRFKMQDDMLLYTGVYDFQLKAITGGDTVPTNEELKEYIGHTFKDNSLTSTTNDPAVAVGFGETMFIIYAPAKSINALGAVCMDSYSRSSENETLLDSGAEYMIKDVGIVNVNVDYGDGRTEVVPEKYVLVELINE